MVRIRRGDAVALCLDGFAIQNQNGDYDQSK
jgi:hypothetical protein